MCTPCARDAIMKTKVQALFRRGCANSSQEDWQQAIEDFNLVLELEPGSDAARRELEKAKEQERRQGSGPTPTRQERTSLGLACQLIGVPLVHSTTGQHSKSWTKTNFRLRALGPHLMRPVARSQT
mmetsp:Transcript_82644/g.192019  ORF Transcript_82644/g.192019 Transcript_82644/m.192019 type:complete len:126 (-) Transcript_82644:550-927(-)